MKSRFGFLAMLFLVLPLSAFIAPAQAQTALKWNENGLSWTLSSTCADGSPASACPLTGVRVERAATATAATWTAVTTVNPTVTSYKDTVTAPGQNCYRVVAIGSSGDSAPSNAPCKTNVAPKPGAPTVADPVAYEFRPSTNTMARIGLVPVGIECGPETKTVGTVRYCKLSLSKADIVNWPVNLALAEVWARAV